MSRLQPSEPSLSTDSFLDVLSNIVGILIILVVVAGARVGKGPRPNLAEGLPDLPHESNSASTADEPTVTAIPTGPRLLAAELEPEPGPEPEPAVPPPEITAEMQKLTTEAAQLAKKQAAVAQALSTVEAEYNALQNSLSEKDEQLTAEQQQLKKHEVALARLQESLGERQQTLTGLLAEFEEAGSAKAPVVEVRHRLTPIGQAVKGEEYHFRLSNNKVSYIPLAPLIERVKQQLERQKGLLARHPQQQGRVGPVDGYTLHYLVEREALSPLEESKLPPGTFRIGVSTWQLVPEPELEAETADQALRRGSRFVAALRAVPPNGGLTFWVYLDSFALFRTLQAAAHAEGFIVSARPLPDGVPIAGSPHGTRSLGQ